MMKKIKIILVTALFVMLEIMVLKASATENPLLKLKYTQLDDKHTCLTVDFQNIPKVSAFSFTIAFDKRNVNICSYDQQTGTFLSIEDGAVKVDEIDGKKGIFLGNVIEDEEIWGGTPLFNEVYPYVSNSEGLISSVFFRIQGEKEIAGENNCLSIYFEKLNNENPGIRIATKDNSVVYDAVNPNGRSFAGNNGEFFVDVVYEGLEDPHGVLDNSEKEISEPSGSSSNSGSLSYYNGSSFSKYDKVDKGEFLDIESVSWAKEAIEYLSRNKIINGYGDGIFAPNKNITREELAKIIVLSKNYSLSKEKSIFNDVEADKWYTPYLSTAYENSIISGYPDGTFGVGKNITRQDLAVMIYRAFYNDAKSENYKENLYSDWNNISDYAKDAISFLTEKKIFNGRENNMFAPLDPATRAEAAKVIYICLMGGN